MPGLKAIFVRLFGGKMEQTRTPAVQPGKQKKARQIEPDYKENTLGYLLRKTEPPSARHSGYDLDRRPEIAPEIWERLENNIDQIPPMPSIWLEMQEILQQPWSSASDLGHCISQDPVLTSRILMTCNSFYYAAAGGAEITNIPLAIARLGMDEASSIIFHSLAPSLSSRSANMQEINYIWFHGQAIARLSRILAESSHELNRHEVSLVGMLHDIGKLAIICIEPQEKLEKLKASIDEGAYSLAAEFDILGYTHIDAGIVLATHWHLPIHVERFIAYHHHAAVYGIDHLPEDMRHCMMILEVAHLVLQHFMDQQQVLPTVWQCHRRSLPKDAIRFIQREMSLLLGSEVLYGQMRAEIERIQLTFSELFQNDE